MQTIEERAKEKFPYPISNMQMAYIQGATEQKEIDIQRAITWLKDNTVRNAFIDDNGLQNDDWQNSFIQAMKEE